MAKRYGWTMAAVGALALLGACGRGQPQGQVVATVNGEDVTRQELNTELGGTNVSPGVDQQAVQRTLLERVIERKLITGLARQQGIDKSPDYLAQSRRLEEVLLAQLFAKKQLDAVNLPSGSDVTRFMAENPGIFSNRQQLVLDQIRFQQPADASVLGGLEGLHTLDGVAQYLSSKNIKFDRKPSGLDSAAIPAKLLSQIDKLPTGEPFVIPAGNGLLTVNVITSRRPIANDPSQARAIAAQAWRQQKVQQSLASQVASARSSAKITYQQGFGPPAKPGASTPQK